MEEPEGLTLVIVFVRKMTAVDACTLEIVRKSLLFSKGLISGDERTTVRSMQNLIRK